jgi:hypothetical protein
MSSGQAACDNKWTISSQLLAAGTRKQPAAGQASTQLDFRQLSRSSYASYKGPPCAVAANALKTPAGQSQCCMRNHTVLLHQHCWACHAVTALNSLPVLTTQHAAKAVRTWILCSELALGASCDAAADAADCALYVEPASAASAASPWLAATPSCDLRRASCRHNITLHCSQYMFAELRRASSCLTLHPTSAGCSI